MSRFGQKGKELNPANDNEFVIAGLYGAVFATLIGIPLSEHNNDFTTVDQVVTFGFFMLGVMLRFVHTQPRAHDRSTVAHT